MSIFKKFFSKKELTDENLNIEQPEIAEQTEEDSQLDTVLVAETEPEMIEDIFEEESNAEDNIAQDLTELTEEPDPSIEPEKKGFFGRIFEGLDKTRKNILGGVENVLKAFTSIDEEMFEELEEALIMADIGVETSTNIIAGVKDRVRKEKVTEVSDVKRLIIEEITAILEDDDEAFTIKTPAVILVIGVNGVGKTTTIGKLANNFKNEGKSVILAAADTFRAAAIDQLEIWGNRNDVPVIKHQENSDPAAVVYDGIQAAKARKTDILICDTAGRLHNKKNLMEELKKINRIIEREYEGAHKEVLLVLDATTGQNALQQARLFKEAANITGLVLTKLDGTAKGGIVIAIKNELDVPVRYIGIGEKLTDLQPFDAKVFASALFGIDEDQ